MAMGNIGQTTFYTLMVVRSLFFPIFLVQKKEGCNCEQLSFNYIGCDN